MTQKAKATVTLTLVVQAEKGEDTYSITSKFKRVLPGRPDVTTLAIQEYDHGKAVLIVQAGGSTVDDPRQGKLDLPAPPADAEKKKGA